MALLTDFDDITQMLVDKIQTSLVDTGTLAAVYYGDTSLIPDFPAAVVIANTMDRSYATTQQYKLVFNELIYVYHELVADPNATDKIAVQRADDIDAAVTADKTFSGKVHDSFITNIAHTFIVRDKVMRRAARLTWEGISREGI